MNETVDKRQELVEFLKNHSIFKVLDMRILEGISPIFSEVHYGPGQIIFKQGDPADAIYIVKQGSVEVMQGDAPSKILAYLTAGEIFGEMALIHETPRTATVRVPESAAIIRLPKAALKELRARFPEVTSAVADVINHRLAGTLPFQAPGLQGNLAFFDLATVIQTVIASRQAGMLILFGRSGKAVAQLAMKDGCISHATFKHLYGETAVLELMTRNDPLDFIFERQDISNKPQDAALAGRPPHMLLIEGARRADELPKLMADVGWPTGVLSQGTPVSDWRALSEGTDASKVGPLLWPLLASGCTVEQLTQRLPFDRYTILIVLGDMVKKGHAAKSTPQSVHLQTLEKTLQMPKNMAAEVLMHHRQSESKLKPVPEPLKLVHGPSQLVAAVQAINAVTVGLSNIFGKNEVRFVLTQALRKAADSNPHLASLKIHQDAATLDVRYATPEFSASEDSVKALENLMRVFIDLAAKSQKLID